MPRLAKVASGFTIVEVLVSLAVFSICIIGLNQAQKYNTELSLRVEKKDRALLVAEDLYEEMLSVPFSSDAMTSLDADAPRPKRLGSLVAYNNLLDSPVHDVAGQEVPWGRDLARKVTVRLFTPQDRATVLPPITAPTGEYAECRIDVLDVNTEEVMAELRFVRAL